MATVDTIAIRRVGTRSWCAYLLRCRDGSLYAGVTNDLPRRITAHNAGRGARYTRARRPVTVAWRSGRLDKRAAHRWEWRLKRLTRDDKLLLAAAPSPARRRLQRALSAACRGVAAAASSPR